MSTSDSSSSSPGKSARRRSTTEDVVDAVPAKKPMFSIFDKKKSSSSAVNAIIDWDTFGKSFIVGQAYSPKAGSKVAAFDLVRTLSPIFLA